MNGLGVIIGVGAVGLVKSASFPFLNPKSSASVKVGQSSF